MLTEPQQLFLDTLAPEKLNRIVSVEPWDPHGLELADRLVSEIKLALPELEVALMGSIVFKLAGEKDLDITVYCPKEEQSKHTGKLEKLFGKYTNEGKSHTGWAFDRDGFHITVFLSDLRAPNTQVQKQLFELLKNRPDLVKEYEQIKLSVHGKTYKEYQIAKYEFYNRVLGLDIADKTKF